MYNVRPEVINCVMREWKRLEKLAMSEKHNLLQCPACSTRPHTINVDGNSKLYRYKKAGGVTEIDYKSELILDSTDVDKEADKVRGSKSGTAVQEVVDDSCGDTKLENAKVGGKAHSSKDETGLMLATCRHVFILKGLDMKRGEIFQYPYILQKQFPTAQFFAYDVACRYYPWLQKFDGETAKKQTPMLSVMHAKSHKSSCQMKWSGKVVKGAGRSTGETCEQANSYLSRLGPVTRNSHSAVRRERITQSAKFWNSRKLLELPVWIATQLSKMKREIKEMEEQFVVMCGDLKKSEAQIEQLGEEYSKIGEGDITPQERKMEELACRYKRLASSILSDPDSSKTRKKHRDMLTKVKGRFESEVDKYLSGRKKGKKVSKKELIQVKDTLYFPWRVSTPEISPGLLAAVDLHHRINRCYEEVEVLLTERDNLIEYINDKLETRQDKSWLTKELVSKIRDCLLIQIGQPDVDDNVEFEEPELESDVDDD